VVKRLVFILEITGLNLGWVLGCSKEYAVFLSFSRRVLGYYLQIGHHDIN
jgi:hypothetical protein